MELAVNALRYQALRKMTKVTRWQTENLVCVCPYILLQNIF